MDNDSSPTRSNSTEEAYITLVNSYINATRDILNGYMTFENGLTRTINNRVLINFINNSSASASSASSASRAATAAAPTATARAPEPSVSVIETPIVQRETTQMPDTPARPSLRFHSNPSSSPFQIPTPVRLMSRLDTPAVEEREPFFTLPRRRVGLSQLQSQPQLRDDPVDPVPRQTFAGAAAGASTPPFASTFVRYRLPVPFGPPRRVPVTSASASDDTAASTATTIPRNLLEVPIFSPPESPPESPSPLSHSISPVRQRQQQERQQQERQQQERQQQERQQRELNFLSPILPVEPTPLPPAPSLTSTASRLMLNLLDTPRFNDSLVYYTQIIDRELSRSRQGHTLSYDVIQQQTKIIPYCTINNPLNDICPISQVPFDLIDSVMQINSCKHNFNPYSLIRWFDTHSTCPMCRQQINVDVDEDYDEQTIHMYNNDGNEEPYRSESNRSELNRYNENNYNFDSEL